MTPPLGSPCYHLEVASSGAVDQILVVAARDHVCLEFARVVVPRIAAVEEVGRECVRNALDSPSAVVPRCDEPLDSGRALSVHIFDLAMNVPGASSRAYGAACVLIALLLIINGAASVMMRLAGFRTAPQVGQGG